MSDLVHNFLEVLTMSLQSIKTQFKTDLLLPTSDFPPAHFHTRGEGECTFHYFFFETTHFYFVVKNILGNDQSSFTLSDNLSLYLPETWSVETKSWTLKLVQYLTWNQVLGLLWNLHLHINFQIFNLQSKKYWVIFLIVPKLVLFRSYAFVMVS